MTLENMLRKKLADPPPPDGSVPSLEHQGWNVRVRPAASDGLGCALWDLTVERDQPAAGGDVRAWAERVSRKATGLLEALRLIEVDAGRQVAILRSVTPRAGDNEVQYYEAELHGTTRASLRRYRGFHEAGHPREAVPFTVTHEALAKLIDDFSAED